MTLAKRITTPGGENLVLLPQDEYERLVEAAEDLADIAAYDEAKRRLASGEDEMVPADIARRLLGEEHPVRVWRDHRGLSVKDLAEAALISPSYLSQIETGSREGTLETMARIARVLCIGLDDLVRPADEDTNAAFADPTADADDDGARNL
ncbi:helix-turn-helix domain-containing protein [Phreatobacter sp. HK31-P]